MREREEKVAHKMRSGKCNEIPDLVPNEEKGKLGAKFGSRPMQALKNTAQI